MDRNSMHKGVRHACTEKQQIPYKIHRFHWTQVLGRERSRLWYMGPAMSRTAVLKEALRSEAVS